MANPFSSSPQQTPTAPPPDGIDLEAAAKPAETTSTALAAMMPKQLFLMRFEDKELEKAFWREQRARLDPSTRAFRIGVAALFVQMGLFIMRSWMLYGNKEEDTDNLGDTLFGIQIGVQAFLVILGGIYPILPPKALERVPMLPYFCALLIVWPISCDRLVALMLGLKHDDFCRETVTCLATAPVERTVEVDCNFDGVPLIPHSSTLLPFFLIYIGILASFYGVAFYVPLLASLPGFLFVALLEGSTGPTQLSDWNFWLEWAILVVFVFLLLACVLYINEKHHRTIFALQRQLQKTPPPPPAAGGAPPAFAPYYGASGFASPEMPTITVQGESREADRPIGVTIPPLMSLSQGFLDAEAVQPAVAASVSRPASAHPLPPRPPKPPLPAPSIVVPPKQEPLPGVPEDVLFALERDNFTAQHAYALVHPSVDAEVTRRFVEILLMMMSVSGHPAAGEGERALRERISLDLRKLMKEALKTKTFSFHPSTRQGVTSIEVKTGRIWIELKSQRIDTAGSIMMELGNWTSSLLFTQLMQDAAREKRKTAGSPTSSVTDVGDAVGRFGVWLGGLFSHHNIDEGKDDEQQNSSQQQPATNNGTFSKSTCRELLECAHRFASEVEKVEYGHGDRRNRLLSDLHCLAPSVWEEPHGYLVGQTQMDHLAFMYSVQHTDVYIRIWNQYEPKTQVEVLHQSHPSYRVYFKKWVRGKLVQPKDSYISVRSAKLKMQDVLYEIQFEGVEAGAVTSRPPSVPPSPRLPPNGTWN
ncbi:unnamed protein product [Vitrella brassicaformis CCMP3155]|uniref:Uncharacterized protein n=4 Tax=Vitrella brassicaformis TaxID=1169539 RepID=A0A0G4E9E9_VITBC|nr:unnamed protein product [Vitrella brassicaformis CCMP3155]|eukprot:CEL92006.1 unnamed protein product [Vitrella brassicaformis CCMP3155]